jgi:hypothetical protein
MANKSGLQLISVVLMVVGVGLAYWGYDMSGGLDSQLNEALSGSSSDDVMIRYIGGAACFAAGLFMFLKK